MRPMKQSFNDEKWLWYEVAEDETSELEEIVSKYSGCRQLVVDIKSKNTNFLQLNTETHGQEYIWGSLIYRQDINIKDENSIFHFYVSKEFFLTIGFDFSLLKQSDPDAILRKMDQAEDGIEGFFILLGEILTNYLFRIDEYEERLHDLLWRMKEQNKREILEKIYENRHELLTWKNLLIPVTEIKLIAEEAFSSKIKEQPEFSRVATRLERARILVKDYQQEIDTMINLEEVVSTHRGNEIMKTLTVMTILFTPVMAWGALWGMNFKAMPELEWKSGYVIALIIIIVSTFGLYFYLKMKGWIGDILHSKKKGSFFD